MKIYLADTGFWIGLFLDFDQYHTHSLEIYQNAPNDYKFLMPWPAFAETLRSQFSDNYNGVKRFEKELNSKRIIKYGDKTYRQKALDSFFEMNLLHGRKLSLTDCILRELIKSKKARFSKLITCDSSDFVDIAQLNNVEVVQLI